MLASTGGLQSGPGVWRFAGPVRSEDSSRLGVAPTRRRIRAGESVAGDSQSRTVRRGFATISTNQNHVDRPDDRNRAHFLIRNRDSGVEKRPKFGKHRCEVAVVHAEPVPAWRSIDRSPWSESSGRCWCRPGR